MAEICIGGVEEITGDVMRILKMCSEESCSPPHHCKGFCRKHYLKHRYDNDPEYRARHQVANRKSREKHKEKWRKHYKKVYDETREERHEKWKKRYREDPAFKEHKLEQCSEWLKNNRGKANEMQRRQYAKLRISLPYRLNHTIRSCMNKSLKAVKGGRHWESLVGYTLAELMVSLEGKFDEHMNWDNYGAYWHIDHKIPKSHFVYDKPEDDGFKQCWALSNLQPLEQVANRKKSNKLGAA